MSQPVQPHILLATDFSQSAVRAQEYAAYLGARLSARLTVLHVVDCPQWLESHPDVASFLVRVQREVEQRLEGVRMAYESHDLKVAVRLVKGIPSAQIHVAAADTGAELVVLGAQGSSGSDGTLLGNVAERVTKTAPCPVLTVPLPRAEDGSLLPSGGPIGIQRVLAPVDFSAPSLESLEYAIQLAQRLNATLTLVHIIEPAYQDPGVGSGEKSQPAFARGEGRLGELIALIKSFGLPGDAMIRGGNPVDAILACAQEHRSDVIVMGTHGRRGFARLRFGSVAEMVLRLTTCPVITVRSPRFQPGHRRVLPHSMIGDLTKEAGRSDHDG